MATSFDVAISSAPRSRSHERLAFDLSSEVVPRAGGTSTRCKSFELKKLPKQASVG